MAVRKDPKVLLQRFVAYLESKGKAPLVCDICKTDAWTFDELVYYLDRPGRRVPVLSMTCQTCGHLHLINPIAAGILTSADFESDHDVEVAS